MTKKSFVGFTKKYIKQTNLGYNQRGDIMVRIRESDYSSPILAEEFGKFSYIFNRLREVDEYYKEFQKQLESQRKKIEKRCEKDTEVRKKFNSFKKAIDEKLITNKFEDYEWYVEKNKIWRCQSCNTSLRRPDKAHIVKKNLFYTKRYIKFKRYNHNIVNLLFLCGQCHIDLDQLQLKRKKWVSRIKKAVRDKKKLLPLIQRDKEILNKAIKKLVSYSDKYLADLKKWQEKWLKKDNLQIKIEDY